jgi:hypothetical protein
MVRADGVLPVAADGRVGGHSERNKNKSMCVPPAAWRLRRRSTVSGLLALGGSLIVCPGLATASDADDKPDPVALWAALEDSRITLEAGLIAGGQLGTPVFAGFDFEDGDLVLIVCIATGDRFEQVVIDPDSRTILGMAPVGGPDDRADATVRKAVLDRGARSLVTVVREALQDNLGARAVDVTPELRDGHPVAVITLLAYKRFAKISRWLE